MNDFEDIEQLLKPQCEFKASETLKQEVMQKAREEIRPRRTIKLWPWLAAACVVGFMMMLLMPPKSATDGEQPVAKVETPKAPAAKQAETTHEPATVKVETPKQPKARKPRRKVSRAEQSEPQEEPVQMSEETRMELLLASLNKDEPQMEDIDTEEEIRQIRMRGERLISMYEENDQ
jgi:type IV secretory pathway VirB10-like protein